jgi:shikimate dehydrogenase
MPMLDEAVTRPNPASFPAEAHLAVIGDPVAHSLSPAMQGAALGAAGLRWTYEAVRVRPEALPAAVGRLQETVRGFNVTVPHKIAIRDYLDEVAPNATRAGAVNTVVCDGGRLFGDNTDIPGFTAALLSVDPNPAGRAVLLGAGGAARAVVLALLDLGLPVTVANRTPARAQALAGCLSGVEAIATDAPGLIDRLSEATIVVNATSLGLHPDDPSPLPPGTHLRHGATAIDLVYGHETTFLREARRHGCRVSDGIEMLVRQGAESFRLWTGIAPDLEVMRAACRRRLEERDAC